MINRKIGGEKSRPLNALKRDLKTGDIILFSGKSLISRMIRLFTFSRWSHIGLVIRDRRTDELLLWEATTDNIVDDYELGPRKRCVQLVKLEEKIRHYRGVVAVRHLRGVEIDLQMQSELDNLVKQLRTASYQNYLIEYLRYFLGYRRDQMKQAFCSQLIAEAYQRLRLIPLEKPPIFYIPKDFAPERRFRLARGRLSRPYVVKAI